MDLPGGDLVEARDDRARNPSHCHRVQDVLRLLAEVGARDGDRSAAFQQAGERLDLTDIEEKDQYSEELSISLLTIYLVFPILLKQRASDFCCPEAREVPSE